MTKVILQSELQINSKIEIIYSILNKYNMFRCEKQSLAMRIKMKFLSRTRIKNVLSFCAAFVLGATIQRTRTV